MDRRSENSRWLLDLDVARYLPPARRWSRALSRLATQLPPEARKTLPALLPKPETASSSATKVYHFHQWKAELNMELRLEVMEFQMFEVKPPACLRTESTPPTSRDSATRATVAAAPPRSTAPPPCSSSASELFFRRSSAE